MHESIDIQVYAIMHAGIYAGRKFMKQRMKIFNQNILDSGNVRKMMMGVFYFSFFIVGIFVWNNLVDETMDLQAKYALTIGTMFLVTWVKQKFIAEVTVSEGVFQNVSAELSIFPVSRKEILWSHYKFVLATQAVLTVLLFLLFLLMQKGLILLDLIWVVTLFIIPIFIVGIYDRKLLFRE